MEGTVVWDAYAEIAKTPSTYMTTSSEMDIEEQEVQEDNIVREEYRKLEEEDFSKQERIRMGNLIRACM